MSEAFTHTQSISSKSLLQYGFIALPVAFAGFPLYVLAPDFYVTNHGLSLTLLGTLLLVIRLFDAVQDPLIGWLTDRFQGRFLTFITVAGTILCLSIFGLFNLVVFSPAAWFALCMVFAVSAYSVLTVVLGAQAALWTNDENDQTRVAGAREAFGLIGLVIAVSMPTVLSRLTDSDHVYLWYALVLAVMMLAGVIIFSSLPKVTRAEDKDNPSLFTGLKVLPPETFRLLTIYGISMLASSFPAVLVIFYVRDLLGAEYLTGLFMLLYFLSGAAAMPLWKYLSARFDKYKAWSLSNILAVAGFIGAFFLGADDIWAYAAVCIISGLALGADLTLPPSILADHIHARGNTAYSGMHYALFAFVAKASLALASAIALPVLDMAGFKPQAANSEQALMTLSATYAVLPCVLKLTSTGLLYGFFIRSQSGGKHAYLQNHGNHRSFDHA